MGQRGVAVVIEDEATNRMALTDLLKQSGFSVHPAATASEGLAKVTEHQPDLVTVDIGLPDFDGIEVSRRIRTFSDAYVIIVSARSEEADALLGFEAGADDYLVKPFRAREFKARVRAMFRRPRTLEGPAAAHQNHGTPDAGPDEAIHLRPAVGHSLEPSMHAAEQRQIDFSHRGLTLHEGSRQAAVDGRSVILTRSQFDILLALMENGRTIQTKADLVHRLRNEPYNTGGFVGAKEERAVEVQVSNLRKRLGETPRRPRWIETVHGVGYRMTP